ncbi:MAG TPA: alkaline phosphatase D family protein, partial [Anaerolineae bacterium]|nr:alkaline phosphatase D family protein [Anaerolineae bacterium]
NGVSQLTAPYPQFKTFPTQGAPASFKFLMITDYHSATTSPTWFNAPAAENPDFVIIGGDFGKVRPMPNAFVKRMRLRFKNMYSRAKNPGLVDNILRRYPVAHMWDDHDFGANNVDKTFPNKHAALGVLQEYFPVYPMTQYGDWQKFSYGNADFFLLDSRSQRDPVTDPDDANKSMLDGDNLGKKGQLEWLKSGLLASTARWKFIVSPDPFNPTVGKPDAWAGFKHERRALVNFIRSHHIGGIILLPGDIHLGAIDDGTHSDFPEMVTPGIISDCGTVPFGPGTWSEGIYWTGAPFTGHCFGYGVITVDAVKDQVRLEVKNSIGKTQLQLTVQ